MASQNVLAVLTQPSECGLQRTLNSVHGHPAAWLQSNWNLAVWMSQISTEWRECSIMTLSTIHWVPVQDKGSKILCVKLGAIKITPSDRLHQEYPTINLGSSSDWGQLQLALVWLCERWRGRSWATGAGEYRRKSSILPIHILDSTATSQDGSSLEFVAAKVGRECNI